jgi:hypothetical protein
MVIHTFSKQSRPVNGLEHENNLLGIMVFLTSLSMPG